MWQIYVIFKVGGGGTSPVWSTPLPILLSAYDQTVNMNKAEY